MHEAVATALKLNSHSSNRRFCVSVSGGLDSTVLLRIMVELQQKYRFGLQAFHMNFGLRGRSSQADEIFVQRLCKRLQVPLTVERAQMVKKTAIQEEARRQRLRAAEAFAPEIEWVEAHHADDQIETFFLRLFRGAGPRGLSAMRSQSLRNGRMVWRPLLTFSKAELAKYARAHRWTFRKDQSNEGIAYDRNFIRNKILPTISKRFPHARESLRRAIDLMQADEVEAQERFLSDSSRIVIAHNPLVLDGAQLQALTESARAGFLHRLMKESFGTTLSFRRARDLSVLVGADERFTFNAPKDLLVRGRLEKGRLRIHFCTSGKGFKPLGVTKSDLALY